MGSRHTSAEEQRPPLEFHKMRLLIGQCLFMALLAMAHGECQSAKPGEIHETCSMECYPKDGTCTETLQIETCPCEGGEAEFELFSTSWKDGVQVKGRMRRQAVRGQGEEILNGRLGTCAEMAQNCETCKTEGDYGYDYGESYDSGDDESSNVVRSEAKKSRKIMGHIEGTPCS